MEDKKEAKYEAVKVPMDFQQAVQTPTGEVLSELQLLVEIANKLDIIKKAIVGQ